MQFGKVKKFQELARSASASGLPMLIGTMVFGVFVLGAVTEGVAAALGVWHIFALVIALLIIGFVPFGTYIAMGFFIYGIYRFFVT